MEVGTQKVFFLGAPKMGTTTVYNALLREEKSCLHEMMYGFKSHQENCDLEYFDRAEYFTDGAFHNFLNLDKWFPDAKFVLLDREIENWSLSVFNWTRNTEDRSHLSEESFSAKVSKFFVGKRSVEKNATIWSVYKFRAIKYFENNPRFIHVNITGPDSEGWNQLCSFLDLPMKRGWDNKQVKKDFPQWLKEAVNVGIVKSTHLQENYPETLNTKLENWLFKLHIEFMVSHYIPERHIVRNLKNAFSEKSYLSALKHVLRYLQIGLHLVLRKLIRKNHILSDTLI